MLRLHRGGGPETRSGTVQSLKCCPCQQKRAARLKSAAQGQHFRLWTVPERVSGPPALDAARRSTFEPRGSFLLAGAALQALDGARARFGAPPSMQAQHLGASRLVSAGRGSTSGSGRCPSAFRLMLPGAALLSLAARFCWQGQHFRLWTVPERVSGPPPLMLPGAALLSLAARFCWQGQHFRLWTVPERVSGPLTHSRHTHVDSLTRTRQTESFRPNLMVHSTLLYPTPT